MNTFERQRKAQLRKDNIFGLLIGVVVCSLCIDLIIALSASSTASIKTAIAITSGAGLAAVVAIAVACWRGWL